MASKLEEALANTPYSLNRASGAALLRSVHDVERRISALRAAGKLTQKTLQRYYGGIRYQQVAESNAIEGSTLSAGETELAVLKGVTITGHDPKYVRDAVALDKALQKLVELARNKKPTDIAELQSLHELILAGRDSPGLFRTRPVTIAGSEHRPLKTWHLVMSAMEEWQAWSIQQAQLPAPIRATILHAWLAHIHPFVDGNGRLCRATTNLELIRSGYPPIVIRRRQDRSRYIEALRVSDAGGDIGPLFDLVLGRLVGALLGLERAVNEVQGYNPASALLQAAQRRKMVIWNRSVELLHAIIAQKLQGAVEQAGGQVRMKEFKDALELDEYVLLCRGEAIPNSWAFQVTINVPGLTEVSRLCWVGYRSAFLRSNAPSPSHLPSLFWSYKNDVGYPPWKPSTKEDAPGFVEMSIAPGEGDEWHCVDVGGSYRAVSTVELAEQIATSFIALCARQ